MKRRGPSVFVFFLGLVLSARSSDSQPVTSVQLMAWLTAGISSSRLARIVHERGIAATPGKEQIRQLESAGADANLVRTLKSLRPAIETQSPNSGVAVFDIPEPVVKAAVDARDQHFHEAEIALRKALADDPQNAALHFALGAMLRQQEEWDDAFDELKISARLMPDLPENHSSMAYIFYRLDDGPNAIAEARTALSMDPQNAEAYQFLALALYSNEQYAAAVNAFIESLARDEHNADTYYDLGITLHAAGNLAGAIDAYGQAIRLNRSFWQAHSNMALVLHEQNKLDEAITEYKRSQTVGAPRRRCSQQSRQYLLRQRRLRCRDGRIERTLPPASGVDAGAYLHGSRLPGKARLRERSQRIATVSPAESNRGVGAPHARRSHADG